LGTGRCRRPRTESNDENPGSDDAGKTDAPAAGKQPDLRNNKKLGTKTFLPVDIHPSK
jgi:hypothetical protein